MLARDVVQDAPGEVMGKGKGKGKEKGKDYGKGKGKGQQRSRGRVERWDDAPGKKIRTVARRAVANLDEIIVSNQATLDNKVTTKEVHIVLGIIL